eukprot:3913673-Rhodomonas_salina.1
MDNLNKVPTTPLKASSLVTQILVLSHSTLALSHSNPVQVTPTLVLSHVNPRPQLLKPLSEVPQALALSHANPCPRFLQPSS